MIAADIDARHRPLTPKMIKELLNGPGDSGAILSRIAYAAGQSSVAQNYREAADVQIKQQAKKG